VPISAICRAPLRYAQQMTGTHTKFFSRKPFGFSEKQLTGAQPRRYVTVKTKQ